MKKYCNKATGQIVEAEQWWPWISSEGVITPGSKDGIRFRPFVKGHSDDYILNAGDYILYHEGEYSKMNERKFETEYVDLSYPIIPGKTEVELKKEYLSLKRKTEKAKIYFRRYDLKKGKNNEY